MGFPYDQHFPSRLAFTRSLEYAEECQHAWDALLDDHYAPVWRVMGKFELLPLEKIAVMKGRDIVYPPFPLTLCAGRLFQEQNDLLSAGYELRTPILSGYTKYFGGHARWYSNHAQWEQHHEFDAVGWDAHFRPEFQNMVRLLRMDRLTGGSDDLIRVYHWYQHQSRSLCLLNSGAVVIVDGMKSGSFNTFSDNSLGNLMFCRYLLNESGLNGYVTVGGDDVALSSNGMIDPDPLAARFGLEYGVGRVTHPKIDDLSIYSTRTVWDGTNPVPCTVRPDKLLAAVHYVPHGLPPEARLQRLRMLAIEGWYSSAGPVLREVCRSSGVEVDSLARLLYGPMPVQPGLAQSLLASYFDGEGQEEEEPGWGPSWGVGASSPYCHDAAF